MAKMKVLPQHEPMLREERGAARQMVKALRKNDSYGVLHAGWRLESVGSGRQHVFRLLARTPPQLDQPTRLAFFQQWTKSGSLRVRGCSDSTIIRALRGMMPRYEGLSLCLYRGATAIEAEQGRYGLSWTATLESAHHFARENQQDRGGSVVLETLAPSDVIVYRVEYSPPTTEEEREETRRAHGLDATHKINWDEAEYHHEDEYIVDGPALTKLVKAGVAKVEVVRRYDEIPDDLIRA